MGMMRPNVAKLLRRGSRAPALTDTSLSIASESRVGSDPEDAEDFAIRSLTTDPAEPEENELWLRPDKAPPELRLFSGGQTYATSFAAVEAEPPVPLVPDVDLAPPLVPEGVNFDPLVPDIDLAPPVVPNR